MTKQSSPDVLSWPTSSTSRDESLEPVLARLAATFAAAGHQLYLVGGVVRDQLLGRPSPDLDLTTDAVPADVRRLTSDTRPDAVYDVGEKFGTIGLVFEGRTVEITTFRSEVYERGSRKPQVQYGVSLAEDLARRDFTINAMARDLRTGEIVDPFGGRDDLHAGLIRAVGVPYERFVEDPLRLLRAARFAAQLGFGLHHETLPAIRAQARLLKTISRERAADELNKILLSPRPAFGIRLAVTLGLMRYIIPEIITLSGVSQRPMHHKDVFEHTLGVLKNAPPDLLVRWASLLHDIAKPQTKSVHDGQVHFFGHEEVGARMSMRILSGLRYDQSFVRRVAKLIRMHLRVNSYSSEWTDGAIRRLVREAGDELAPLIALSRADVTSYREERVRAAAMRADEFERRCEKLLAEEDIARMQSPLDGHDLMALFGQGPGRWIQEIKDYLLTLVLDGELAQEDRERATALAVAFAQERDTKGAADEPAHPRDEAAAPPAVKTASGSPAES
ncbi:MAG: RNA nucleotidyltransferase [Dehalococcoidia bacterium]|nr:RNA nucleotidyltransferase [Dehalococcoidia bacterium]